MGKAAARVGDKVMQDVAAHCHNPAHPHGPVVGPESHPAKPLAIVPPGSANVKFDNKSAARQIVDQSKPCKLPGCIPGGPGIIAKASKTVLINKFFGAAREGDMTAHFSCIAPVPSPKGKIVPPCSNTVKIGD
jgi:uncharacterized Zn-binding protein involved in type VI secretion